MWCAGSSLKQSRTHSSRIFIPQFLQKPQKIPEDLPLAEFRRVQHLGKDHFTHFPPHSLSRSPRSYSLMRFFAAKSQNPTRYQ